VKLISSNIRFDNPKDQHNDWNGRRLLLSKCLNDFSPDIIGTQEGRKGQLEDLEGLLINLKKETTNRDWIPERMYPTIFYNPKTITILASGDIWLSTTPEVRGSISFDSTFPRLFTWIRAKNLDFDFFFINVHLDHGSSNTRICQAKVLIQEAKRLNFQNLPIIIIGDFNEGPSGEVKSIISNAFPVYDPWEKLGFAEEGSHHRFQGPLKDSLRIDWILCDKSLPCEEIFFDKTQNASIYPSDHYPLKAVISTPVTVRNHN
jgi:endonuclease/exonuclease/phosphatase family metal-dependent hydrolase